MQADTFSLIKNRMALSHVLCRGGLNLPILVGLHHLVPTHMRNQAPFDGRLLLFLFGYHHNESRPLAYANPRRWRLFRIVSVHSGRTKQLVKRDKRRKVKCLREKAVDAHRRTNLGELCSVSRQLLSDAGGLVANLSKWSVKTMVKTVFAPRMN